MEKEVPRRPWWRGGTGGRKKGEEDERPAQTASRQRLLAISRHSPRTLATWEGFVKDGLKNIRTKKRRREEPAFECRGAPVVRRGDARVAPPLPHHLVCVEKFTLPYLTLARGSLNTMVRGRIYIRGEYRYTRIRNCRICAYGATYSGGNTLSKTPLRKTWKLDPIVRSSKTAPKRLRPSR